MNILEKVASVLRENYGHSTHEITIAAITTFLEAAAAEGWHMRPDAATEEMGEAWAKLALDRIQKAVEGEMRTVGMVKGAKENYCAMLTAAPEFKWKDDS